MAQRTPCLGREGMSSATSPNQEGIEGTDSEEVWMITEESAILVISTSLLGTIFLPHQGGIFLSSFATAYISLRNSWARQAQRRRRAEGKSPPCGLPTRRTS